MMFIFMIYCIIKLKAKNKEMYKEGYNKAIRDVANGEINGMDLKEYVVKHNYYIFNTENVNEEEWNNKKHR